MNLPPAPGGVFATNFMVDVGNWRSVRNQFRGVRGELGSVRTLFRGC